jgi:hypothetical protein
LDIAHLVNQPKARAFHHPLACATLDGSPSPSGVRGVCHGPVHPSSICLPIELGSYRWGLGNLAVPNPVWRVFGSWPRWHPVPDDADKGTGGRAPMAPEPKAVEPAAVRVGGGIATQADRDQPAQAPRLSPSIVCCRRSNAVITR